MIGQSDRSLALNGRSCNKVGVVTKSLCISCTREVRVRSSGFYEEIIISKLIQHVARRESGIVEIGKTDAAPLFAWDFNPGEELAEQTVPIWLSGKNARRFAEHNKKSTIDLF